jgi:putative membrane protein
MSRLRLLFTLPLLAIVVVFAVANRGAVPVDFWPFPWSMELPLFAVAFGAFFLGAISGGLAVWLGGVRKRRRERRLAADRHKLDAVDGDRVDAGVVAEHSGLPRF